MCPNLLGPTYAVKFLLSIIDSTLKTFPLLSGNISLVAIPTLTVNVLLSGTVSTPNTWLYAGSVVLGYECCVAWLSLSQVNVNDSASKLTELDAFLNPFSSPALNQCSERSSDIPTLTSNLLLGVSTLETSNHLL